MWKSILISALFCGLSISGVTAQETEDNCIIYVPNTASVSGDCFDCHLIRIGTDCDFEKFEFLLFDRWGNILFETTDPAFEYEPTELKDGVYVYRIVATTRNEKPRTQTGNITILK